MNKLTKEWFRRRMNVARRKAKFKKESSYRLWDWVII